MKKYQGAPVGSAWCWNSNPNSDNIVTAVVLDGPKRKFCSYSEAIYQKALCTYISVSNGALVVNIDEYFCIDLIGSRASGRKWQRIA